MISSETRILINSSQISFATLFFSLNNERVMMTLTNNENHP